MPMWCVAPLEMNEGNSMGARVQSAYRLQCRKSPTRDLQLNLTYIHKSKRQTLQKNLLKKFHFSLSWTPPSPIIYEDLNELMRLLKCGFLLKYR